MGTSDDFGADLEKDLASKERKKAYMKAYREANKGRIKEKMAEWREKNADHLKEYGSRYMEANKDAVSARMKEWRQKNKERIREYNAAYSRANAERISQRGMEYRKANREVIVARNREWFSNNRDKKHAYLANRRSAKKFGGHKLSPDIAQKLLKLQGDRCVACKARLDEAGFHIDHIIPLSRGGTNEDKNVQLLCPPCNQAKAAKHPIDFMRQRGFLL